MCGAVRLGIRRIVVAHSDEQSSAGSQNIVVDLIVTASSMPNTCLAWSPARFPALPSPPQEQCGQKTAAVAEVPEAESTRGRVFD